MDKKPSLSNSRSKGTENLVSYTPGLYYLLDLGKVQDPTGGILLFLILGCFLNRRYFLIRSTVIITSMARRPNSRLEP